MNKPLNASATAGAAPLSAGLQAAVQAQLDDPAAAERDLTERIRTQYYGDHPEWAVAKTKFEEFSARLDLLRRQRDRHDQAMGGGDLMRERLVGRRRGTLTKFDFGLFACIACIGVVANMVALVNLATYVADSGVIKSLTDNVFRSLFVSAIPFTGSALIEACCALQADNKAERAFTLRIGKYAVWCVVANIVALTIFFAPHKLDPAALAAAVTDGVSPSNPLADGVRSLASYLVLGTGLLAEMLSAPVIIHYAQKLHRAGREIIVKLHDEQQAHLDRVDALNSKIDSILDVIGQTQSAIDKHATALATMTTDALHREREMAADYVAMDRQIKARFFAKRAKEGVS